MSFLELISFSKVFSVAMGLDNRRILSRIDLEIASKVLDQMIDEAPYWNQVQRETYKLLVDFVKKEMENAK